MFSQLASRSTQAFPKRNLVSSAREALRVLPPNKGQPAQPENLQVSEVNSNVKVLSLENQSPLTTLSLYVKAGSRYETPETEGVTHFLKHLAFKDTQLKSGLRLIRDLEHIGATYYSEMSRETVSYHIQAVRPHDSNDVCFSVLVESIMSFLYPMAHEYEVRTLRKGIQRETDEVDSDPRAVIIEKLHSESFGGVGIGRSLYAPAYTIDELMPKAIHQHVRNTFYKPQSAYVVTTGLDHRRVVDKFASLAKKSPSAHLPAHLQTQQTVFEPSNYTGGTVVRVAGADAPHVGVAFPGLALNHPGLAALYVLKSILGGAQSQSLNPGSDHVTSRLTQKLEQNSDWLTSAQSFVFPYSDAGLFGILASSSKPGSGGELVNLVRQTIQELGNVSDADLHRAKTATALQLDYYRNSNPLNFVEEVSRNVLAGKQWNKQEFSSQVQSVTAADVKRVAEEVFNSAPVVVAAGDIRGVPSKFN